MAAKSEQYYGYIKKTLENRSLKIDKYQLGEWKLSERTEEDYALIAASTSYELPDLRQRFGDLHLKLEQVFYFTTRYDFNLVTEYLETSDMSDLSGRLRFLVEIKADFDHHLETIRDLGGFYGCNRILNFGKKCEIEIERVKNLAEVENLEYERDGMPRNIRQFNDKRRWAVEELWNPKISLEAVENQKGSKNEKDDLTGNLRQRVFTLLIIRFGSLGVPDKWQEKPEITILIDFITFLTRHSRQNVKEMLEDPTNFDKNSPRSRNNIIKDLRAVEKYFRRNHLEKQADLVLSKAVLLGISEKEITG